MVAGIVAYPVLRQKEELPELKQLIESQEPLRYAVGGYSPLGRSPVVDAILEDPFYLPAYANQVSAALSKVESLYDISRVSFTAGGIPTFPTKIVLESKPPTHFVKAFGKLAGQLHTLWKAFLQVNHEIEQITSVITEEERTWLLESYEAFFFGKQGGEEYDFWTTDSPMPLKFFEMAARLDITALVHSAQKLTLIVDAVYALDFSGIYLEDFRWEEEGVKLFISSQSNTEFAEEADFFISLGSHNVFKNSAGGTRGRRPSALHISVGGYNSYEGDHFVQGSGFLGVGILANFGEGNSYKALSYSQGAGFLGVGLLANYQGHNQYELDFFGQSAAAFGASYCGIKVTAAT